MPQNELTVAEMKQAFAKGVADFLHERYKVWNYNDPLAPIIRDAMIVAMAEFLKDRNVPPFPPEPPTEKMRESKFDKLVQAELSKDPRT